jgi:helix-turn-helix protein
MGVASTMWKLFEPIHSITYFERRSLDTFVAAGIRGFWRGYFAGRSAPLGPVGAAPIVAAYYNFSPQMVGRALPSVWSLAGPEEVLRARSEGAVAALTGLVPDVPVARIEEAAELLETAAAAAEPAGRVLGAANQALPRPSDPYARLFQAATTLREHRGDGHVAALLTAGLDPTEALVSFAAVRAAPREVFDSRGWSPSEWDAAADRLRGRGLLAADGSATAAGQALRDEVERITDELAAAPWAALGPAVGRFAQLTAPITMRIGTSGLLPSQSTLGIRRPA